jgi:hypothetical protein
MEKMRNIIDIFVNIIDNYGDMGFATEFIQACRYEYWDEYQYSIWTNEVEKMIHFVRQTGISDIEIGEIGDFWYLRKSAIWISLLHAPIPDLVLFTEKAILLRIDYISLDPTWIWNNEREHISSTSYRRIIELIPSSLGGGAGLIVLNTSNVPVIPGLSRDPAYEKDSSKITGFLFSQEWQGQWICKKHITIFAYHDSLNYIDFDSFTDDLIIYVFGEMTSMKENIISLDFLPSSEFYHLLDTSEFVIIRWEVTFAHMIQTGVPFFWNIYSDIGGFPIDQSEQYLSYIDASAEYRQVHQILNWQKVWKIQYTDFVSALSHTQFDRPRTHNLIHTVKKHIDRFNNSI